MPRFVANITMMFQEVPFIERFAAAAKAGFKAVEFMFPYEYPVEKLNGELDAGKLQLVLFNLPAGDWAGGDRGLAVNPARRDEFRAGVQKAITYATALGVKQINCLVGKKVPDVPEKAQRECMVENLRYAADQLAAHEINLLVEPINFRDMPGFFLNTTAQVLDVMNEVDRPNVYLQFDIYHAQRVEGELIGTLRSQLARIGHIQIADNPGRHEPGTGEINYRFVFAEIDNSGYGGYVGLEYIPEKGTVPGLGWIDQYGYSL